MGEAFITGSHAYGAPTENSDVDLVVLVSPETRDKLIRLSDDKCTPVRYGNINLIVPMSEAEFRKWKLVTDFLVGLSKVEGPIGHDQAKSHFMAAGVGSYRSGEVAKPPVAVEPMLLDPDSWGK